MKLSVILMVLVLMQILAQAAPNLNRKEVPAKRVEPEYIVQELNSHIPTRSIEQKIVGNGRLFLANPQPARLKEKLVKIKKPKKQKEKAKTAQRGRLAIKPVLNKNSYRSNFVNS